MNTQVCFVVNTCWVPLSCLNSFHGMCKCLCMKIKCIIIRITFYQTHIYSFPRVLETMKARFFNQKPYKIARRVHTFCGSFMFFSVLCLLCLCVCLFICALWSQARKWLTSWLSFVVSDCEFVTFPLVSWVRCGTCLYRFLIFAPLLTFVFYILMI